MTGQFRRQYGQIHSDSSKLTTKNMGRFVENDSVTCYANHADLFWQPHCSGKVLRRGFFRVSVFRFNLS